MFPAYVSDVPQRASSVLVAPRESGPNRPGAFVCSDFVTAVVAGQVITVPRNSVLVGSDGALTLPVQD